MVAITDLDRQELTMRYRMSTPSPSDDAWPAESELYRTFHGRRPDRVELHSATRIVPPVVVQLGMLRALIYRSDKWTPGIERTYIHVMQRPPRLVCDPHGTQLYLIGGGYRVTERGIEG